MTSINSSKESSNPMKLLQKIPTNISIFCYDFFQVLILYLALRSAGGGGQNVISRQWENGKPVGDFNWGSKPRDA